MSQHKTRIHDAYMSAQRRDRAKFIIRAVVGLVVLNVVLLASLVGYVRKLEPKAYFGTNWEEASFNPETKRQWLEEALKDHMVKPAAD